MSAESLTLDCLVHIFSYLEAPDLLRAAQVNKVTGLCGLATNAPDPPLRTECLRRRHRN